MLKALHLNAGTTRVGVKWINQISCKFEDPGHHCITDKTFDDIDGTHVVDLIELDWSSKSIQASNFIEVVVERRFHRLSRWCSISFWHKNSERSLSDQLQVARQMTAARYGSAKELFDALDKKTGKGKARASAKKV